MVEIVKHLLSKNEAISSTPVLPQKKKKEWKEEREEGREGRREGGKEKERKEES
jgi:hypothetical protein